MTLKEFDERLQAVGDTLEEFEMKDTLTTQALRHISMALWYLVRDKEEAARGEVLELDHIIEKMEGKE